MLGCPDKFRSMIVEKEQTIIIKTDQGCENMQTVYDCIIVGGGIAGLQAAIQLGRYRHRILVVDSNNGRSSLCRSYHNLLGWPDGVSGETLRRLGRQQANKYNVEFIEDKIIEAEEKPEQFMLIGTSGNVYQGKRLLLATGVMDRLPPIQNMIQCLGTSIYVCPDCDGFEVTDQSTLVLGAGETGANMALTLYYWTKTITYINHDGAEISESLLAQLNNKGIKYIREPIDEVILDSSESFAGVRLENGQSLYAEKAFVAFGNNAVNTDLAKQLGVERLENKHVPTNPRTKETNVKNVWIAGDIGVHSELVTVAMAEGAQAAVWIHKSILNAQQST